MESILGPIKEVMDAVDEIPILDKIAELENAAGDFLGGMFGDEIQDAVGEIELPEEVFERFCEAP
jgi:hypothetical protein